jgi:hypothetical protein
LVLAWDDDGVEVHRFSGAPVGEASTNIIVFADRHPAHEAQEAHWLEGHRSDIDLECQAFMRDNGASQVKDCRRQPCDDLSKCGTP